jgi:hypothetical protein
MTAPLKLLSGSPATPTAGTKLYDRRGQKVLLEDMDFSNNGFEFVRAVSFISRKETASESAAAGRHPPMNR